MRRFALPRPRLCSGLTLALLLALVSAAACSSQSAQLDTALFVVMGSDAVVADLATREDAEVWVRVTKGSSVQEQRAQLPESFYVLADPDARAADVRIEFEIRAPERVFHAVLDTRFEPGVVRRLDVQLSGDCEPRVCLGDCVGCRCAAQVQPSELPLLAGDGELPAVCDPGDDAGENPDAGERADAEQNSDAGEASDAGESSDAGHNPDVSEPSDGGETDAAPPGPACDDACQYPAFCHQDVCSTLQPRWGPRVYESNGSTDASVRAVAVTDQGSVFAAGEVPAGTNVFNGQPGDGAGRGFVARYTPEGAFQWARRLGSGLPQAGIDLVVEPGGTELALFEFRETVTVDSIMLPHGGNTGRNAVGVLRLDANGRALNGWAISADADGQLEPVRLARDVGGRIYVVARLTGDLTFEGEQLTAPAPGWGILLRLPEGDSGGWARVIEADGDAGSQLKAVATGPDGRVYVAGTADGPTGASVPSADPDAQGRRALVVAFTDSGSPVWDRHFVASDSAPDTVTSTVTGLAVSAGQLLVAGSFNDFMALDLCTARTGASTSKEVSFVGAVRLSTGQCIARFETLAATGQSQVTRLVVDDLGRPVVGLRASGELQVSVPPAQGAGLFDAAAVGLKADRSERWSLQMGGEGNDDLSGVALGPDGLVVLGGQVKGPATVPGGVDLADLPRPQGVLLVLHPEPVETTAP